MLFNSDIFIFLFLPITWILFFLVRKLENPLYIYLLLIAASLFFYSWWNPIYLPLLVFSISFNFVLSRYFYVPPHKYFSRRNVLVAGIAGNLAVIAYFKYSGFFADNLSILLGADIQLHKVALPLAISFFTFQQIAYLVDSYRNQTRQYGFLQYCVYVSFFPQLIAGPIVYHSEVMGQIEKLNGSSDLADNFYRGLNLFIIGLAKKVLIADNLAIYAQMTFNAAENGEAVGMIPAYMGTLAYTFQLYFDFSGYSDMAIGLALMFQIRLPFNFDSPYKATNIIDFWRRWHVTLSRFLKVYLYIPLGGNRKGDFRRLANILVTMILGGLWHGASWNFIFWGLLHGLFLVINHAWIQVCTVAGPGHLRTSKPYVIGARVLTFVTVVLAWVFFRAETFDGSILVLEGLLGRNGLGMEAAGSYSDATWYLLPAAVIAFLAPTSQAWLGISAQGRTEGGDSGRVPFVYVRWPPTLFTAVAMGGIAFATIFMMRGLSEFLYFQF